MTNCCLFSEKKGQSNAGGKKAPPTKKNLFDYLEAGDSIENFLDDFPSVTSEQVHIFLKELQEQTVKDRLR